MELEVLLVIVSAYLNSGGKVKVLLFESPEKVLSLPSRKINENETSLEVAAALLMEVTGLEARVNGVGWLDMVQSPLRDALSRRNEYWRVISVPYGVMLPEEMANKHEKASWVPLTEVFVAELFKDHKEILLDVCARL